MSEEGLDGGQVGATADLGQQAQRTELVVRVLEGFEGAATGLDVDPEVVEPHADVEAVVGPRIEEVREEAVGVVLERPESEQADMGVGVGSELGVEGGVAVPKGDGGHLAAQGGIGVAEEGPEGVGRHDGAVARAPAERGAA